MFASLIVGVRNSVRTARRRGFPELHFKHSKARLGSDLVNRFCEIFCRRVSVEQQHGLMMLPKDFDHGVFTVQNHVMVEILIDPMPDGLFDVTKIGEHSSMVEIRALNGDDSPPVMAVQEAALPIVVDEAMAVAERDFFGDSEHRPAVSVFRRVPLTRLAAILADRAEGTTAQSFPEEDRISRGVDARGLHQGEKQISHIVGVESLLGGKVGK